MKIIPIIVVLAFLIILSGCKTAEEKSVGEPVKAGKHPLYLDPECKPYHRVWVDPKVKNFDAYKKIYIAPFNIDHLKKMAWREQMEVEFDWNESFDNLAKTMRQAFIDAQKNNPEKKFIVVDKPDQETLILKTAIIECVPDQSWFKLVGYKLLSITRPLGTVAIEGKLLDGGDDKVLGEFMFRQNAKSPAPTWNKLHCFSHTKPIMKDWGQQLVKLVNIKKNQTKDAKCPFTLLPW